jgi:hypothetical protein
MKATIRVLAAAAIGATVLSLPRAQAATWNFLDNSLNTSLGSTVSTSNSGVTISATGFSNDTTSPFSNPANLYDKSNGGSEVGLGFYSTLNHEIIGTYVIEVNLANAINAGLGGFEFSMNSTSSGETWKVYGTNTANTLGTSLLTGSTQGLGNLTFLPGSYTYYNFIAGSSTTNDNVLLQEIMSTTTTGTGHSGQAPLPAALPLFLSGIGLISLFGRRRRKAETPPKSVAA